MKVLWVTNVPTPEISLDAKIPINHGGGWLNWLSLKLSENNELTIVFPTDQQNVQGSIHRIKYYGLPWIQSEKDLYDEKIKKKVFDILDIVRPEIIHIWGTEYLHSTLVYTCASNINYNNRIILSIQGLVSIYASHYWAYIDNPIIRVPTFKDFVRKSGPLNEYKDFIFRGRYEKELIASAKNIIGRTDWDKACIKMINPSVKYYSCNEIMRPVFYENTWDYSECDQFRVFMSQGSYPIKGLHLALEAISILKKDFKSLRLYVAGRNPLDYSFFGLIRENRYDRYIRKLIEQLDLKENVIFLGRLNEEEICEQFLKANVFISPSSIENSSNSIAEAMLLGVPVISSDVGGIKTFIKHGENGLLYQADAPYMLADSIRQVFNDNSIAVRLSEAEHKTAGIYFSRERNYEQLLHIYGEVINGG